MFSEQLQVLQKISLFKGKKLRIKRLNGGFTNTAFQIRVENKKYYSARFYPAYAASLGIKKNWEISNTRIAAREKIGPRFHKWYPKKRLLILEYLPGQPVSSSGFKNKTSLKQVARLLKKLHNGRKFSGHINLYTMIDKYIRSVKKMKGWLPPRFSQTIQQFKKLKKTLGPLKTNAPCHLDTAPNNIIIKRGIMKLIDWEYSANSDWRFDLAMLSVIGKFSKIQDTTLTRFYDAKNPLLYAEVRLMKGVVHLREAAWGLVQHAHGGTSTKGAQFYKKYTLQQLKYFDRLIKSV